MSVLWDLQSRRAQSYFVGAAIATASFSFLAQTSLQAHADEIIVNISRVKALDRSDNLSRPDFLARVTISGEPFVTKPVMNRDDIQPTDWVFRKSVPPGKHDVKIEILDKDVTKNESIDINRIDGKRDIDFAVDTRRCVVTGFSPPQRCGARIVRAGAERKKAEITFSVDARR
jgi:hypothetical protein